MATVGSLLGNYAPQMEQPYPIESTLSEGVMQGNPAAISLLGQYNFERQLREGDYASRLADQMAFGQRQLQWQQADTALKAMPELAKNNLLPATASTLMTQLPQLDPSGLQYASNQAAASSQAANAGNYGRLLSGAGAYGINIPSADISAATGMPGITPGTPTAVQAQTEANKGRLGAAALRAGAEKTTNVQTPPQASLGGASVQLPVPRSVVLQGPDAVNAWKNAHGWGSGPAQTPNPNATNAPNQAPPPVVSGSPAPAPAGRTNLPPAPTTRSGASPPPAPAATTTTSKAIPPGTVLTEQNAPGSGKVLAQVKAAIDANKTLTPEQRANLANPQLRMGSDGKVWLHGADGKPIVALGQQSGNK